jgi:hypothetical protein
MNRGKSGLLTFRPRAINRRPSLGISPLHEIVRVRYELRVGACP